MRKLLNYTSALLLLATPVLADPPSGHGNRGNEGHGRAEAGHQGPPPGGHFERGDHGRGPGPQASVGAQPNRGEQNRGFDRGNRGPAPQASIQRPPGRVEQNRGFDHRPAPQASIQAPPNRGGGNHRAFNDNRDFNRDGRTDFRPDYRRGPGVGGPRRDFSGFRDYHRDFRVSRRFYAPAYRRPAGWFEHRWSYGEFLPAAFWARDYWLIDFGLYDLPPPPFGAIWVRVGYDALLIDEETGEIITVAYDVFY